MHWSVTHETKSSLCSYCGVCKPYQ